MKKSIWIIVVLLMAALVFTACTPVKAPFNVPASEAPAKEEAAATEDQVAQVREARVEEYAEAVAKAAQTQKGDRILITAESTQVDFVN